MGLQHLLRWGAVATAAATAFAGLAVVPDPADHGAAGQAVHGTHLYVATSDSLDRYDLSDGDGAEPDWSFSHVPVALPDEELSVGGGLLLALLPTYDDALPDGEGNGGFVTAKAGACDGGCLLHVFDITGDVPELLSVTSVRSHTVSCLAHCRWAMGSDQLVISLENPRQPVVADGWGDADATWSHHVQWLDETTAATTWGRRMQVLDVSDPHRPEVLANWETDGQTSGNHVTPARGTDLVFVGEFSLSAPAFFPATCGIRWFDATVRTEGDRVAEAGRWVPSFERHRYAAYVNSSCMVHLDPHPAFAENGLVAASFGAHGIMLLHFDGVTFEVLEHVTEVGGHPVASSAKISWVGTDRVATSLHEGAVAFHTFDVD